MVEGDEHGQAKTLLFAVWNVTRLNLLTVGGGGGRGVALLSAAMERKLRCRACGLIVNVKE